MNKLGGPIPAENKVDYFTNDSPTLHHLYLQINAESFDGQLPDAEIKWSYLTEQKGLTHWLDDGSFIIEVDRGTNPNEASCDTIPLSTFHEFTDRVVESPPLAGWSFHESLCISGGSLALAAVWLRPARATDNTKTDGCGYAYKRKAVCAWGSTNSFRPLDAPIFDNPRHWRYATLLACTRQDSEQFSVHS